MDPFVLTLISFLSSGYPCTLAGPSPWHRDPEQAAYVIRASSDTVRTGTWYATRWEQSGDVFRTRVDSTVARPIYAQAYEVVRQTAGPTRPNMRVGSRLWLVNWVYGPDCMFSPSTPQWLPAGETAFFAESLRPDSLWIGGLPTADVIDGGYENHRKFAYAAHHEREELRVEYGWVAALMPAPLQAHEYAEFYTLWPTEDEWKADRESARRAARSRIEQYPHLLRREPVRRLLDQLDRVPNR